jgi:hypothetical protein
VILGVDGILKLWLATLPDRSGQNNVIHLWSCFDGRVVRRSFPLDQSQVSPYPVFTCSTHGIDGFVKLEHVWQWRRNSTQRNGRSGCSEFGVGWRLLWESIYASLTVHPDSKCTSETLGPIPCNCRITAGWWTESRGDWSKQIRGNSIWLPCNNERVYDHHQENLRKIDICLTKNICHGWFFLLIPTSSVEGRDTCMDLENFYVTPCFSHDYQLTLVEYNIQQNTQSVCTTREKRQIGTFF